ncbi:MAG: hypothetical protein ACI86H_001038 [bacterium]|jgi:hypothetical protein
MITHSQITKILFFYFFVSVLSSCSSNLVKPVMKLSTDKTIYQINEKIKVSWKNKKIHPKDCIVLAQYFPFREGEKKLSDPELFLSNPKGLKNKSEGTIFYRAAIPGNYYIARYFHQCKFEKKYQFSISKPFTIKMP